MDPRPSVFEAIRDLLGAHAVAWEELAHEPVRTSEEAARARGLPLRMGAKSIVFKAGERFGLFVLSAAAGLRSREVRRHLQVQRTRFATARELAGLTGLERGAVPPFGEPILPLPLFVDPALLVNERIAFTPGRRDRSIVMAADDYLRVARPEVFSFSR